MSYKYFCLETSFDHFIQGDVDWFDRNWNRFCVKNPRGRMTLKEDTQDFDFRAAESVEKIPKGSVVSMVNYGFAGRIAIDIINEDFLSHFPSDIVRANFFLGKILYPSLSPQLGWTSYRLSRDNFVDGIGVMLSTNESLSRLKAKLTGGDFYTSRRYSFILREDIFDSISGIELKDIDIHIIKT